MSAAKIKNICATLSEINQKKENLKWKIKQKNIKEIKLRKYLKKQKYLKYILQEKC